MIGDLFTVNLDNVIRAAMAEVMKDLTPNDAVEVTARLHENGTDALILVTGTSGDAREIVVTESTIIDCLNEEDLRTAAQALVNQLAAEVRRFVNDALG